MLGPHSQLAGGPEGLCTNSIIWIVAYLYSLEIAEQLIQRWDSGTTGMTRNV